MWCGLSLMMRNSNSYTLSLRCFCDCDISLGRGIRLWLIACYGYGAITMAALGKSQTTLPAHLAPTASFELE
jgi:hypothetical protein